MDFNTRKLMNIAVKAEAGGTLDEGEMCFLIRLARQRMDDLAATVAPKAETPVGVGEREAFLAGVQWVRAHINGVFRADNCEEAADEHVLVRSRLAAAPAADGGRG